MQDCFEMLGIEFDPPDNTKKIKAAFDEWKKRLTTEQNTTVDVQRLNEIKEQLAMSDKIIMLIENQRIRENVAKKLKEERIKQLRSYIYLLRDKSGITMQVTRAQMKKVSEKLKLSLATVEATYKQEGFEIKNPRNKNSIVKVLNEFFMSDSVMNDLRKNFIDFQTFTDFKRYAWSPVVNNLYELALKLDGREPVASSYRNWSAEELSEIFRREAQQISGPVPEWHSIKNILNIAQMQVFNSNENKYRYNHSLDLEPLNDFFQSLKSAPEIFKRDSFFANKCIDKIQNQKGLKGVANNYELAISLYNKFAGLLNDPYESAENPAETEFYITCGNCQTSTHFRTREALQNSKCPACGENFYIDCPSCRRKIPATSEHCTYCGFSLMITCSNCHTKTRLNTKESLKNAKCPACGESFYIDCPKCGKKIPSASERCPHCDFHLVDMKKFFAYIDEANEILTEVEKAQKVDVNVNLLMNHVVALIVKARQIKPDDLKLKSLEDRVDKATIAQKKQELMSWAKSKLPSLSVAPDKAVLDCIEILQKMNNAGIKNYRPAIDRLRLIKPKQPTAITAIIKEVTSNKIPKNTSITNKISVNGQSRSTEDFEEVKLTCTITWQPANDFSVKYQLVKKIGGVPLNNKDGEILLDKSDRLEFEDKNIFTGVKYGYAVFAVRVGAISDPATCEVVHYSDIEEKNLIAKTEDGFCHFSWIKPSKKCIGVRILRSDSEGNSVVIDGCCRQSPFVDRAVRSKRQYYYRLQCVYDAADDNEVLPDQDNYNKVWKVNHKYEYSDGLTVNLTPESPPTALQNISYHVINNNVTFNWRSTGDFTVYFREMKNTQLNIDSLKQMVKRIELNKLDNILGSKKIFAATDSRMQSCEFKLTDEFCKIAVISATQTLGVICDVVTIANITPCTINKDKTSIDNGKLKIILNPLPDNLVKIHYALTNKNNRGRLYMTIDDAKNNRMRSIFAKKYELDKVIIIHSPPQMELYLTVIGEYKMSDGSTIFSEPSTEVINNRPKAEIVYWFEWATSGILKKTLRAKNCKLIIETNSEYIPSLYLAYNKNGGSNIELDEPSTIKIRTIQGSDGGLPGGRQEYPLDNSLWEGIAEGTFIKLLPSKKDAKHFDIRPAKPESLRVPQK